jgi:uncharacterized protein YgfB (UPF0149 family)
LDDKSEREITMALETAKQVEQLADALTASADAIHARLMKAIKDKEISKEEARTRQQDEAILRQRANALYLDAALHIVSGLKLTPTELLDTITEGHEKLKKLKKIAAFLDFIADILALSTAIYAGKPPVILAAFKEVKKDIDEFERSA